MKRTIFVHGLDCSDAERNCCSGYDFNITEEQYKLLLASDPNDRPIPNWPLTAGETLAQIQQEVCA